MQVPLQGSAAPGLRVTGVHAGLLVIPVARVPRGAVLRPWTFRERKDNALLVTLSREAPTLSLTHAHPAELVLALLARHMVAAPVLLDRALALAALLRVALDPVRRLAVVAALLQPHLRDRTHDRPMVRVNRAAEAENVRA